MCWRDRGLSSNVNRRRDIRGTGRGPGRVLRRGAVRGAPQEFNNLGPLHRCPQVTLRRRGEHRGRPLAAREPWPRAPRVIYSRQLRAVRTLVSGQF
ncbi:MAG: hypothetical protein ACI9W2_004470 [Gammaproteobacteria bacterium]|jgi:hypothetical protein